MRGPVFSVKVSSGLLLYGFSLGGCSCSCMRIKKETLCIHAPIDRPKNWWSVTIFQRKKNPLTKTYSLKLGQYFYRQNYKTFPAPQLPIKMSFLEEWPSLKRCLNVIFKHHISIQKHIHFQTWHGKFCHQHFICIAPQQNHLKALYIVRSRTLQNYDKTSTRWHWRSETEQQKKSPTTKHASNKEEQQEAADKTLSRLVNAWSHQREPQSRKGHQCSRFFRFIKIHSAEVLINLKAPRSRRCCPATVSLLLVFSLSCHGFGLSECVKKELTLFKSLHKKRSLQMTWCPSRAWWTPEKTHWGLTPTLVSYKLQCIL